MVPTRGRGGGGGGVQSPAHLSGIKAAQPSQVQLNERPEGATDALQPEQLAQRDPVQDVREQHVFPGQVQEPEGKAALTSLGRCYVRVLLLYPRVPAGKRGPGPARAQLSSRGSLFPSLGPSSARYLTAPGSCSPPDCSIGGSIAVYCACAVSFTSFGLEAAAANPPPWSEETDRFNRVRSH